MNLGGALNYISKTFMGWITGCLMLEYFAYEVRAWRVKRANLTGSRTDMSPPGLTSDEAARRRELGMALVLGACRERLFGLCGKNCVASQLESESSWGVLGCFLCLSCDCKGSNGAWNWMHNIVKLRVATQQCSRRFSLSDNSPLQMLSSQLSSDSVLSG